MWRVDLVESSHSGSHSGSVGGQEFKCITYRKIFASIIHDVLPKQLEPDGMVSKIPPAQPLEVVLMINIHSKWKVLKSWDVPAWNQKHAWKQNIGKSEKMNSQFHLQKEDTRLEVKSFPNPNAFYYQVSDGDTTIDLVIEIISRELYLQKLCFKSLDKLDVVCSITCDFVADESKRRENYRCDLKKATDELARLQRQIQDLEEKLSTDIPDDKNVVRLTKLKDACLAGDDQAEEGKNVCLFPLLKWEWSWFSRYNGPCSDRYDVGQVIFSLLPGECRIRHSSTELTQLEPDLDSFWGERDTYTPNAHWSWNLSVRQGSKWVECFKGNAQKGQTKLQALAEGDDGGKDLMEVSNATQTITVFPEAAAIIREFVSICVVVK